MKSEITAARELLESARKLLGGSGMQEERLREVLDLTIEAFVLAEHTKDPASPKVVKFPIWRAAPARLWTRSSDPSG